LANAVTGFIVEETGWVIFFCLCTLLAIPGMVTLLWVAPWQSAREQAP
jgi:PAT family beta-lactamase induction signal transducer AmpG